jgi:hypothetical protein
VHQGRDRDHGALLARPACGTWSARPHCGYVGRLHDSPGGGRPVLIRLAVRRFRCQDRACPAVTIVGQADGLTTRYQHRSVPLARLLARPRPEPLPPGQQERQTRPGPEAQPPAPRARTRPTPLSSHAW